MTAPIGRLKTISLRNAYLVRQPIAVYDEGVDSFIPYGGDTTEPTVRFSVMPDGFNTDGSPSTIAGLGPFVMTLSGATDGVFFAIVSSDALTAALVTLVGTTIYQVVEGAYGTTSYGLTNVLPLLVIDPRFPAT